LIETKLYVISAPGQFQRSAASQLRLLNNRKGFGMRASSPTATILSRWLRRRGTLPCDAIADVRVELEIETTPFRSFSGVAA
jgi:hypothetical protein